MIAERKKVAMTMNRYKYPNRKERSLWVSLTILLLVGGCTSESLKSDRPLSKTALELSRFSQYEKLANKLRSAPTERIGNYPADISAEERSSDPQPEIFIGSGEIIGEGYEGLPRGVSDEDGDISFNFKDASIRSVVDSVLGELLHLNYVIDPRIEGTITLKTNRPMNRETVLQVLKDVLQLNGVAIEKSGEIYAVQPASGAAGQNDANQRNQVTRVVPLNFVSAGELEKIMRSVATSEVQTTTLSDRNVIIVKGSSADVSDALDLISVLDIDLMSGMSFGLFTLHNAIAKGLAEELETVFHRPGDEQAGRIIRFVPIMRLNALLVIAPQASTIRQVKAWIDRLDRSSRTSDRKLFIYHVQNGRAVELAQALNELTDAARSSVAAVGEPANDFSGLPTGDSSAQNFLGSGIRITAETTNNALLILATDKQYELVEAALSKLDVMPRQVLIEAVVAEVTLTNALRYGVQWLFEEGNFKATLSNTIGGTLVSEFPGFSAVLNGSDIGAVLNALESLTTVRVVSSPRMMVRNNQTATLQVGDQVPVATQAVVSIDTPDAPVVNTIQFRDTGIILKVTPHINASGLVQMDIMQEVSDVTETTTSNLDSPTIQQRMFESSISIADGETVAMGGLIRDRREEGDNGIPILKEIPILGNLFKATGEKDARTELLVLITPRVATTQEEMRVITEDLKRELYLSLDPGT